MWRGSPAEAPLEAAAGSTTHARSNNEAGHSQTTAVSPNATSVRNTRGIKRPILLGLFAGGNLDDRAVVGVRLGGWASRRASDATGRVIGDLHMAVSRKSPLPWTARRIAKFIY